MNAPLTRPEILGTLGHIHELLRELVQALPETDVNRPVDPTLGCIGWQLAESVYRETYWLREVVAGDAELTARIRHLFEDSAGGGAPDCASLPPPGHLLAWASEIQDEHLRRLATPGGLPAHPLLADDRLTWFLVQESARIYERMIALRWLQRLECNDRVEGMTSSPTACPPRNDRVEVVQGHYRIGSRHEPFAYDNELPPQAVELASFRIARYPVGNAEYLAFIDAGGYRDRHSGTPTDRLGWRRRQRPPRHPRAGAAPREDPGPRLA
jgi:iron(II)-dependent oxidoreductase